ncbi:MAG: hypothetical protein COV44_01870 [Deltaproteobacteria bacterium CG11_big_fil_rev_8_21_14_0_20_45_16]|nr:MAG: hypothetical protein COV44_01870 [Deltaproteobacteria bacterium CG11_big_fil_rev_8_21_14_0_20_45_16]
MPLTEFQSGLAKLLSENRSPDSHLAGGAAIHIEPKSLRYSNDLDYFQDSDARVAEAFALDKKLLEKSGFTLKVEINQAGYIRAIVSKAKESTKLEWAHDTAWRFLPVMKDKRCGYILHPIDLAINKVLTLAGRNEARDFLDALMLHESTLSLGAMCWAAAGKDPGFNPRSLLELLKRRGRFHDEDFARLKLRSKPDLTELKSKWLEALESAEAFIATRPSDEVGCLYYSKSKKQFITPTFDMTRGQDYELHYGCPGGVLPRIV